VRIAVVGAGAVGGYFGGRLAEAGEDVVFVARGEHLRAIREGGLDVRSTEGDFRIDPARATDDPSEVSPVDAVIFGVKAWQLPEVALQSRPLVGESTAVVPLQNGVEAPSVLREALGPGPVLGGLCRILAHVSAPGRIEHTGFPPSIEFGELDGSHTERVQRLAEAFTRTRGVEATVPDDIEVAMWIKFVFIAAISGVGSLTRAPAGVIRSLPETRDLLARAMEEVRVVGVARGIPLPDDLVTKILAFVDGLPADQIPSMQRDVMGGRPSELEAQVGAVVRLGREAGVATPINGMVHAALLPQERRARGEGDLAAP
jgi:2-dehydropantoate 2-reductase